MVANKLTSNSWDEVDFSPLFFTTLVLVEFLYIIRDKTFFGYKINNIFRYIHFVSYCYKTHYCLIVLDVKKETITQYDPLHAINDDFDGVN